MMNGESQNNGHHQEEDNQQGQQPGHGDQPVQQSQENFTFSLLESVHKHFNDSLLDSQEVDLKHYCDAWHELTRFLDTLGTLFHFVTQDVKSKVDILLAFLKSAPDHYRTINGMLNYEVENSLTKTKKPSGSRTLLRLHRALNYILAFFNNLAAAPMDAKVSTLSSTAYNDTLGKYHPWIVRKAAGLAMYSLPIKSVFLQRIDTSADAEQKFKTLLEEISQRGTPIYKITEDLYTDMKLHDLP